MINEEIKQLVDNALKANPSLFLIDFSISNTNEIKVILDGDNGVTLKDCIAINRYIEDHLDRDEEDFSVQVLSAGVSEPLKNKRQFVKNIGRKLKITTQENIFKGELIAADEEKIQLKWKTREAKPVGKGKITITKEQEINHSKIVEAKVMITF